MLYVDAENIDVEEGDRIFVSVYNSNSARNIALDSFVNPTLSVEVLE